MKKVVEAKFTSRKKAYQKTFPHAVAHAVVRLIILGSFGKFSLGDILKLGARVFKLLKAYPKSSHLC
jgi:hypothetical protein